MIKRLLSALVLSSLLVTAANAQLKIAVVDMAKVFSDYYKSKDAENVLRDRMAEFRKEEQDLMEDYQKLVDEIQKLRESAEDKTLSESARDERRKALQTKAQDAGLRERKIQEFRVTRSRQIEDQVRRVRQGIVDEIVKLVNDTGAKEKYSMIFDKSGLSMNGTSVLLYSQDVKDITQEMITALNATKPAAGKDAPKKDEKK